MLSFIYRVTLLEKHGLAIKPHFTGPCGFVMQISKEDACIDKLPRVFLNPSVRKKQISFTCMELMKMNERIQESMTEIYLMSDKAASEVLEGAREVIGALYVLSESLALLDLMGTLAAYALENDCGGP